MTKGEITAEECRARQLEHAEAIAALKSRRSQEAVLGLVRGVLADRDTVLKVINGFLDHPLILESVIVGAMHFFQAHGVGGGDGR